MKSKKRKTSKQETVSLADSLDSESSSRSESNNSSPETGKPQSPRIQILPKITKSAAVPLASRTTIDSMVAEMHLS